jgi:DNA ligase D-like protein (predicted ligase)
MREKELHALPPAKAHFSEPMYAKTVQFLPEGSEWLYEIKLDGYRCLAGRNGDGVTLWSRKGNLFTRDFPNIAHACELLPLDTLIDGEVVALDKTGRISFNILQHHRSNAQAILFYAFDLLIYRGRSLLDARLETRRELLIEVLGDAVRPADSPVHTSEAFTAKPRELLDAAKDLGLEGIIAKQKGSLYESGKRSGAWVKYKINKSQELVIGGYTPDSPFDALVVGYYDGSKLTYVAKVRNGFVPHVRREVFARFKGLAADACPFVNLPEKKRSQWALTKAEMQKCRWLKPKLVVQIEFTECTPDGHLRHSTFVGLRDDKDPSEVIREE